MLDLEKTESANKMINEPEITKTESVLHNDEIDDADGDADDCQPTQVKRKLPGWAIWIAVIAFVVFNAFFLVFAMQIGSVTPSD